AWGDGACQPMPYAVAVGAASGRAGLPLDQTLTLFLQAYAANLVSAAIRLVPLGQAEGQRIIADLMDPSEAVAHEAANATLEEIGGCAILSDIASMRHETQTVRLFRS
ncbi:MAG: urease accessory UreF family protein, partial [Pseudomonadota bacterium]